VPSGEPLWIHAQELLEVLLDQPEKEATRAAASACRLDT
jgi:hypothetical protein